MKLRSVVLALLLLAPSLLLAWPQPGEPAPDFALPDTAGVYHSLSDFRGQVVHLFWFWSG